MEKTNKQSILTPLLTITVIVLSLISGFLWQRVKVLEKEKEVSPTGVVAGETENRLSVNNLKKYAKELGLDSKKFDNCLDKDEKKEEVNRQKNEGMNEGISGTPGFFLNGRLISGAIPFEMFKTLINFELKTGFDNSKNYPEEVKKLVEQGVINTNKKEVKIEGYPAKGSTTAKITLVEYSDFECPYCGRAVPTIKQILEAYPNDIRLVFKQFPLDFHPNAQKAAEAALCAFDQGKFWEYHDKLFGTSTN